MCAKACSRARACCVCVCALASGVCVRVRECALKSIQLNSEMAEQMSRHVSVSVPTFCVGKTINIFSCGNLALNQWPSFAFGCLSSQGDFIWVGSIGFEWYGTSGEILRLGQCGRYLSPKRRDRFNEGGG